MKVGGTGGAGPVGQSSGGKRSVAPGFAPEGAGTAGDVRGTSLAAGVSAATLDALIALQATPSALERRRRAVKRASGLLDVLDDVKLALLEGGGSAHALDRLRRAVGEARDGTEDPRLEGVLDEIETRAAVELAKQEVARRAA